MVTSMMTVMVQTAGSYVQIKFKFLSTVADSSLESHKKCQHHDGCNCGVGEDELGGLDHYLALANGGQSNNGAGGDDVVQADAVPGRRA